MSMNGGMWQNSMAISSYWVRLKSYMDEDETDVSGRMLHKIECANSVDEHDGLEMEVEVDGDGEAGGEGG